jgi:hypothetical protein
MSDQESPEVWRNPHVIDTFARRHYRGDLEFHNYPHATTAAEILEALIAEAVRHGIDDIEEGAARPAGLYHDAGVHLWLPHDRFPTKEALSADLMTRDLRMLHAPQAVIEDGATAIRATSYTERCATSLGRALRQADLIAGGVFAGPVVFVNGTYRLYREGRRLDDEMPTPPAEQEKLIKELSAFGAISHEVMLAYAEEDVAIGAYQRDPESGESLFNRHLAANIGVLAPGRLEPFLRDNLGAVTRYDSLPWVDLRLES